MTAPGPPRRRARRSHSPPSRLLPWILSLLAAVVLVLLLPAATPAAATPASVAPTAALAAPAPDEPCSVEEWQADPLGCVSRLGDSQVGSCPSAPVPGAPDSGLAGWFASRPDSSTEPGPQGLYSEYGYAGYSYPSLGIGCGTTLIHPEHRFENTVANGEFMIATAVVGASNALRERAWDPGQLWGWADPLVHDATRAIYDRVFSVFGVFALMVVGLYLLWRSRQADMSAAMTTAGWALLVMVVVTALAAWPVRAANLADATLVTTLGVVHDAVGPRSADIPPERCPDPSPGACTDHRPPAVRASDTAVETMLYRHWLRGLLGSADSDTARTFGPALYDAASLTWDEAERLRANPAAREALVNQKQQQWAAVAAQVQAADPEAYEYLSGNKGMERIGAGFIAVLAALLFALFDLTASLLVLLGFLLFRWAVVAAPILGTIGLLRPASAGIRRLANAVVAAIFNIAIFGTGAAIYLFAVDLIMSTATLPGWLQVILVWLCGMVGWLLLRPYRRITQLGGRDPAAAVVSAGSWHRRFFRDTRDTVRLKVVEPGGTAEPQLTRRGGESARPTVLRPETRHEESSDRPAETGDPRTPPPAAPSRPTRRRMEWQAPDVPEQAPGYAVYRPGPTRDRAAQREGQPRGSRAPVRAEAR